MLRRRIILCIVRSSQGILEGHSRPLRARRKNAYGLPVTARRRRRDPRSEIFSADPRQDAETGVVDNQGQAALASLVAPADRRIARPSLAGARAKTERRRDLPRAARELAHLRPRQRLIAKIVMALNVDVPPQRFSLFGQRLDGELCQVHRAHPRNVRPTDAMRPACRGGRSEPGRSLLSDL